jgi:hypothetical protein
MFNIAQCSPWEADSHSATQEIPHLLWNSKVYYSVQKQPATGPYPEPDESNLLFPTLTPWSSVLLEKLIVTQLVKFPTFYGTRMFITVFTRPATRPFPEPDESNLPFPT